MEFGNEGNAFFLTETYRKLILRQAQDRRQPPLLFKSATNPSRKLG